jgi:hypothetical protein
MKNVLNITVGFVILFSGFMTVDSLAIVQPRHRLGFVKAKKDAGYGGPQWYWLAGNKTLKENEVIFYDNGDNSTFINIDGQDIALKKTSVKLKSNKFIKVAEYKSRLFRVKLKDFKDVTTARDRKGCTSRARGFLEIIGNDGWTKKIQVDTGEDTCG